MALQIEALVGKEIGGYRLVREINRGGGGAVFEGLRDSVAEPRAIKVLLLPSDTSPEERTAFEERFMREARAAMGLEHEHIVRTLGYGEEDGVMYLVLPYFPAGTLQMRLAQGPLSFEELTRYTTQLCGAVDYAHQHGIIHRDIKPANVLLDEQGNAYLSDFGIAHLREAEAMTVTGQVLGTYGYMAPEQMEGAPVSSQTDIYALGVLIYQLVTLSVPFSATTFPSLYTKILRDAPPSPTTLRRELPMPAEQALLRALAKRPEDRFPTAEAFAAAFVSGLQGEAIEGSATANYAPLPTQGAGASTPSSSNVQREGERTTVADAQQQPAIPGAAAAATPPQANRANQRRWAWIGGGVLALVLVTFAGHAALASGGTPSRPKVLQSGNTTTLSDVPSPTVTATLLPSPTASVDASATAASSSTANASASQTPTDNQGTPVVTPSGPAPAPGTILYSADWSNGMDGWSGSTQWKVNNGMLLSDGTNYDYILTPYQLSTANYKVVAHVKLISVTGNGDGRFGIVSRVDTSGNGYAAGLAGVNTGDGNPSSANIGLDWAYSRVLATVNYLPSPLNDWHTYVMSVQNNQITLLVDGKQLLQTTDNTYLSPGNVGLYCGGSELEISSFQIVAQ